MGYIKKSGDALYIAQARETGVGKVIFDAFENKIEAERRNMEQNPRCSDTDVKNHIYYKLGVIEGLKFFGKLEDEAKTLISKAGAS